MIVGRPGYRVGLAGASSLLGQEILRVLKDRGFPVARLSKFDAEPEEPDLPVLDLSGQVDFEETAEAPEPGGLDLLVFAVPARAMDESGLASFVEKTLETSGFHQAATGQSHVRVIDADGAMDGRITIPALEKARRVSPEPSSSTVFVSPHAATIVLSSILLRLADRFGVKSCVAQVFLPASEMGPRGIEELQRQAVNLLSFQKIPQKVFGAQLAFNLLARLPGKHAARISRVESRIRRELHEYLSSRAVASALHFCHAAVFYSLAFSIFVELADKPAADAVSAALAGERVTIHKRSEAAPNQVEAAGSGEILVDAITTDPDRPDGFWIWATVDNIRLAAENAIDIAESLFPQRTKQ